MRSARGRAERLRAARLRRPGPRGGRGAGGGDGAAGEVVPLCRLDESAASLRQVRGPARGRARDAAARGPVPAGAQPEEPGRACPRARPADAPQERGDPRMEMTGEQLIPASQQETWEALNDPEVLKACVPGCESIDRLSDTEYQVLMVVRGGPVSAEFKGKLALSDLDPPQSYSIAFEGQGGAAGFAKGGARVRLPPPGASAPPSHHREAR